MLAIEHLYTATVWNVSFVDKLVISNAGRCIVKINLHLKTSNNLRHVRQKGKKKHFGFFFFFFGGGGSKNSKLRRLF